MASFKITNITNFTINIPYRDIGGNKRNVSLGEGASTVIRMSNESSLLLDYKKRGFITYTILGKNPISTKSKVIPKNSVVPTPVLTQDPNKKLSILLVNWNNANLTNDIINDLGQQVDKGFDVTIVEQNSKERGTADYVKIWSAIKNFPIKIIRNDSNVDLNRVWDQFYENSDSDYLCFLNNDVRVGQFFTHDIRLALNKDSVGCVIHPTNKVGKNKELCEPNIQILSSPRYQGWDFTLKRSCYRKIPNELRIFGGDNFLFAQVVKQGFDIALANSSPIIHLKEKTRVKNPDIKTIHKNDGQYWAKITKEGGLKNIPSTMPDISEKYPPNNMTLTMNDKVVYTSIIGSYDSLPKIKCGRVLGWDFICFTDSDIPASEAKGWRIIKIPKVKGNVVEKAKSARYYKLAYFEHLSRYRVCLWLDCRVDILQHPNKYLTLLNNHHILFAKNPSKNFDTETRKVIDAKVETPEMIEKIVERYQELGFNPNKYHSIASGAMIFRNNSIVEKFFRDWWSEVEKYSHRDQLSVPYALEQNKSLKFTLIEYSKVYSGYFKLRPRKKERLTVYE